jgi:hypothetical protein
MKLSPRCDVERSSPVMEPEGRYRGPQEFAAGLCSESDEAKNGISFIAFHTSTPRPPNVKYGEALSFGWSQSSLGLATSGVQIGATPILRPNQPPIQRLTRPFSQEVKRSGRDAGPSSPTSAAIRNTRIYTSIPSYVSMA